MKRQRLQKAARQVASVPEQGCDFEVTFTAEGNPTGERAPAIEIVSNAASSPDHISVRGSVMAPISVPALGPLGLIVLALLLMGLAGWRRSHTR